jgi:hypothetical protein
MQRQDSAVGRVLGYHQENVSECTLGPSYSEIRQPRSTPRNELGGAN